MAKSTPRKVSQAHKDAMAAGRADGRIVRNYLEALETSRPKRGRKRTPESIQKQLDDIGAKIESASALRKVGLVQQRIDLQDELARLGDTVDITPLEADFVRVAKGYSERKGISYAAWREVGVSTDVLKAAGITRGS